MNPDPKSSSIPAKSGDDTPTPTTTETNSKKTRCSFNSCQGRVVKIIGDCKFCSGKFCARHRTVEAHSCANIDKCKQAHYQKNEKRLMGEKTNSSKLQQVS